MTALALAALLLAVLARHVLTFPFDDDGSQTMANQNLPVESALDRPAAELELTLQLRLDVNDEAQLRSVVRDLHSALPDEKWKAVAILADAIVLEALRERGLVTVVDHRD